MSDVIKSNYKGMSLDPLDPQKAVERLRLAAQSGNIEAQFMLGYAHETGTGAVKDVLLAMKWYRKAALQGVALNQAITSQNSPAGEQSHSAGVILRVQQAKRIVFGELVDTRPGLVRIRYHGEPLDSGAEVESSYPRLHTRARVVSVANSGDWVEVALQVA